MKHSIRFALVPDKSAPLWPIRVRVSWAGTRLDVRLGISVEPSKWNSAKGCMVSNTKTAFGETAYAVNRRLSAVSNALDELFDRADLITHCAPGHDEVRECVIASGVGPSLEKDEPPSSSGSVFPALSEFVSARGRQREWTTASYHIYSALEAHLRRYDENLTFFMLDERGLQGFVDSLHGEGLRNTTIAKQLFNLKTFLRWCLHRNYLDCRDFEDFHPLLRGSDGSQKEVIYLEWDELMLLNGFVFPPNHRGLAACRDVFCFQCFTGLRYSDVAKLTTDDVYLPAGGGGYISVVTQKTRDALRIELNKYSRAILERYAGYPFPGGLALPVISNAKMNVYLKEVGRMAGLDAPQRVVYFKGSRRLEEVHPKWELLTTHCGRRTFVVNALVLGIPSEVIMKWTGHKDFKAMRPYIKIIDQLRVRELDKFNRVSPDPKTDPKI